MSPQNTESPGRRDLSNAKRALLEKRLRGQVGNTSKEGIPVYKKTGPIPLSFAQERLWFLHQIEPQSPAYNMYNVVRLQGVLDIALLVDSFNALIQRHQVLRTCFVTQDDQPYQKVVTKVDFELPVVVPQLLGQEDREDEIQRLIKSEIRRPFDLTQSPILRALLIKESDNNHILVTTIHHIIFDEWSNELFWKEFSTIYQALSLGEHPDLPELNVQYTDFSIWQKSQINELMSEQLNYWSRELDGELPFIELPTDHPRPIKQTFRGALIWRELPNHIYKQLISLNKELGTTMFMSLMATFQVLLTRYTGQTDILVGTPIANRTRKETKSLVGFFLNTLVFRADFTEDKSFLEFASHTRTKALDAYAHQDLPFEKLVNELQPNRDLSHNPIFQVMFVHQKSALEEIDLPDLEAEEVPIDIGVAKFDITMFAQENDGALNIGLEYNRDLIDNSTAERILSYYQTLLESILKDPQQQISKLDLIHAAERNTLLWEWNNTASEPIPDTCVHQLIESQCDENPEKVAVADTTGELTYKQLNKKANQLANHLRRLGVGPDTPVGLLLDRSLDMAVTILAVLKAGGAYLPLDPAYPRDRLGFMLEDAQAPIVITTQSHADDMPSHDARIIFVDGDWPTISQEDSTNLEIAISPENLAYIIYTSGSTGQPRGVPVTHHNLVHSTLARDSFYESSPESFLLLSSFTFDSSIVGIFWTLCKGGKLVLPPQRIEQDMPQLASIITNLNITHTLCLPSLYALLLELADLAKLTPLQVVIVAGEACQSTLVKQHHEVLPSTNLYNEYGPTEATVWSTAIKLDRDFEGNQVPIGRPIPNTQNYILDQNDQPVPIGVLGELCIAGAGVTRGYLNDPQETSIKFFELSFDGEPARRLYRTGDRARYLPDGNIEFLGRIDQQVKIRGNRVELGEIENILRRMPGVKEAIVDKQDDRLVAYVIPESILSPPSDWRTYLVEFLPDYMIPASFMIMDEFPRTPNGKLDRNALPKPSAVETRDAFVPPTTETEKALAEIWKEILGVERVGIHDNFFDLGGDSILSIRIMARVNQAGLQLAPMDLFKHQTISQLAAVVGYANRIESNQDLVVGNVPLTPIQKWFFDQSLSEPDWWNQALLLQINTAIEINLLEKAFGHLLKHHDLLRARYKLLKDDWQQTITEDVPSLTLHSYFLPSEPKRVEFIERTVANLQAQNNLSNGPLIQAACFTGDDANYLFVSIHHLVIDNVSWGILVEDLELAYNQLVAGESLALPSKTTSFKQWAEKLALYPPPRDQLEHWQTLTQDAQPLQVDGENTKNLVKDQQIVTVKLKSETTQALVHNVPSVYRTQINEALLTALLDAFYEFHGQDDLLLALEGHGREILFDDVDVSRTVGWFTAVHPLRLHRGKGDLGTRLRAVKDQLRAIPQRGIGYGLLRYYGDDSTRSTLNNALQPEILFNYLGRLDSNGELFRNIPLSLDSFHGPNNKRQYLIEINAHIENDELVVNWTHNPDIHRTETIKRLATEYITALEKLVSWCETAEPAFTPLDFDLLTIEQSELDRISALLLQLENTQVNSYKQLDGFTTSYKLNNVVDILPLTDMQQLMLLHAQTVRGDDILFSQFGYLIEGPFDPSAFERAWGQIIHRHTILRTIFLWDGLQNPVQVVLKLVPTPITYFDWRNHSSELQDELYQKLLNEDMIQKFDPRSAPLMRLTLIRTDDDRWRFVWSNHHLILDRWCIAIIMRELHHLYAAYRDNDIPTLSLPDPYRDYVAYASQQDEAQAESFWREMLDGVTQTTSIEAVGDGIGKGQESIHLSVDKVATLQRYLQQQRLTLNSVLQGSLALIISRYSSNDPIVYGVTVSGRPPELPGVSGMLGSFINNLPFRVDCTPETSLPDWLRSIQQRQQMMQPYQHFSPIKVQDWSSINQNKPLFEILYLYQAPIPEYKESLLIRQVEDGLQTNYPLTLVNELEPDGRLLFQAIFDRKQFNSKYIINLLNDWQILITEILKDATQTLSHYLMKIEPPEFQKLHQEISPVISPPADVKTSNETEKELIVLWQDLLEVQSVSVNDDFFEIGGSSLMAMHMFMRIEEQFKIKLPLSVLFTDNTIGQLAARISKEKELNREKDWSLLVPIQPAGEKIPFFCVHGLTGDVLWFRQLGQMMASDQPFYGIQARGLNGETVAIGSIEQLAISYIKEIKKIQPNGPYFLGGASLGGTVALEMAQQLQQHGEEVALLIMFDHPPNFNKNDKSKLLQLIPGSIQIMRNFPNWVSAMRDLGGKAVFQRIQRKVRVGKKLLNGRTSEDKLDSVDAADILDYGNELPEFRQRMIEAHWRAINNYLASPYDKPVLLLQAKSQPLLSTKRPETTWEYLATGDLTIITVPGSHEGMFKEPHVHTLAQELTTQLNLAQSEILEE